MQNMLRKLTDLTLAVKHIWEQTIGKFPETGIGAGAKSFAEYYKAIADAFNNLVDDNGTKLYYKNPCYTKVTYYKNRLQFPLSPAFLETVEQNKPCRVLTINPSELSKLKATKKSGAPGGIPGIGGLGGMTPPSGGDMPNFAGNAYD